MREQVLGWKLRRLRVAKGLSQERLALATAIDGAYVGRSSAAAGT
jgi:transcriptional regulator with XRE-family HTH domain